MSEVKNETPKIPEGMELVLKVPKIGEVIWSDFHRNLRPTVHETVFVFPTLVPKAGNPYGMSFEDAVKKYAPGREMECFAPPSEYIGKAFISQFGDILYGQSTDVLGPRIILKPKPTKVRVTVELTTTNRNPGLEVGQRAAVDVGMNVFPGRITAIVEVVG
jgi:hypothetical protein